MVRAVDEGGGGKMLVSQRSWSVFGTHAAFFHHHFHFFGEVFGAQVEIGHAISFQLKTDGQATFFQLLEIGGVILSGKGIFTSAIGGDDARKLIGAECFGAFEHHVL